LRGVEDESSLVARAGRDPEAFGCLYDLHVDRIYRFIYARVRERALAEDLTADAFINALHSINRYRPSGVPFAAWLYRIAANRVADHYRRLHPAVDWEELAFLPGTEPLVLDEVVARERSRLLWAVVDRLPGLQRAAIILRYGEDLTIDAIAQVLGKSPGAVNVLLWRAVCALRRRALAEPSPGPSPAHDPLS